MTLAGPDPGFAKRSRKDGLQRSSFFLAGWWRHAQESSVACVAGGELPPCRRQEVQAMMSRTFHALVGARAVACWLVCLTAPVMAQATAVAVYRCPGPPVLYTDAISAQEARDRGCRTIEGAPITIVQGQRPRVAAAAPAQAAPGSAARPASAETKVDANAQKARDSDAKRILAAELRREEEKLAALLKDFNNGEPERRGDERNFQKYQDRVTEMKASIGRSEANVAALKRELSKHP